MPPRRRTSKRRGPLLGSDGLAFLFDDGVRPLLDRYDARYTEDEAAVVWDQVRAQVWHHDLRGLWPPMGAIAYDGITQHTAAQRPSEPSFSIEAAREAVAADMASVKAFKRAQPARAATIADELDAYVEDLRVLLGLAERLHDRIDDEFGRRRALGEAWMAYQIGRRDQM